MSDGPILQLITSRGPKLQLTQRCESRGPILQLILKCSCSKSYETLKWINQKQSIGAIYIILRKMRRKRGMDKV